MSDSVTMLLTPERVERLHADVATRLEKRERTIRKAWGEIREHSGFPEAMEQAREELTDHCKRRYGAEPSEHAILLRAAEIICEKYRLSKPF